MPRGSQKPPSQRQLRVGEEIRHLLARIIERGDIRDPDVAGKLFTVTEVSISPDLRNAEAFIVQTGGGDIKPLLSGLKRVATYFRHELAKAMALRTVPLLRFTEDVSFDRASRIEALLALPEVRRDLVPENETDETDETDEADGA